MNPSEKLNGAGQFVLDAAASSSAVFTMNPAFEVQARVMAGKKATATKPSAKPKGTFYSRNMQSAKGFKPVVLDLMKMRGLKPNLLAIVPNQTVAFKANDVAVSTLARMQKQPLSDWQKFLCGMFGGAAAGFSTTGLEKVRTIEQVEQVSTVEACKKGFKEGPKSFFFGWKPVVLREMKFQGFFFGLQDFMKAQARKLIADKKRADAVGNAATGLSAAFFSTPEERMRVLMQNDSINYPTLTETFFKVVKDEGPKGLFRGWVPRTLLGGGFLAVLGMSRDALPAYMPSFFFSPEKNIQK